MTRCLVPATVGALAALIVAATGTAGARPASEHVQTVHAHLDAGQQVPSPDGAATGAHGTFSGTYDSRTRVLTWRLQWVRVSQPTTDASIHYGRRGRTGRAALLLCKPCHSPASGHAKLAPGLARAILQPQGEGLAYVSVDTERNPLGEIRGEIVERCPC